MSWRKEEIIDSVGNPAKKKINSKSAELQKADNSCSRLISGQNTFDLTLTTPQRRSLRGFESVRRERKVRPAKVLQTRGSGGMLPENVFILRGSEMPLPAFSARHFQ